jgi:tetratricopeptide (TPR) repeat protein
MAGRCALLDDDLVAAERAFQEALAAFEETGVAGRAGWILAMLGSLEAERGDLRRGEEILRDAVRRLRRTQEGGFVVEAERQLAEVLVSAGKLAEAEQFAQHALKAVGREDVWSRASTLHALGRVRAAQGKTAEAEALLRESLAIAEPTMYQILADEVRASLEALRAPGPAAVKS